MYLCLLVASEGTYSLDDWATGAAGYTNVACRLHEVRRADIVACVLLVFGQEEIAESLHRIVDLARAFVVAEKERTICATAGREVGVILRGVTSWKEVFQP